MGRKPYTGPFYRLGVCAGMLEIMPHDKGEWIRREYHEQQCHILRTQLGNAQAGDRKGQESYRRRDADAVTAERQRDSLKDAIDRSPYEVGTCTKCGELVVWLPGGRYTVIDMGVGAHRVVWDSPANPTIQWCESIREAHALANELNEKHAAQHGPVCEECSGQG